MSDMQEVLLERRGQAFWITINRPDKRNALHAGVIATMREGIRLAHADAEVRAIVVTAVGEKAFCAGGDVKQICLAVRANGIDDSSAIDFFSAEYRLDYLIHQFAKPFIVWATGFVMGGGIGLLAGASHRIVTETSRLAMPEITIGLYPDVGGSWFLARLGKVGLFLGMTGAQINAADALQTCQLDRLSLSTRAEGGIESLGET